MLSKQLNRGKPRTRALTSTKDLQTVAATAPEWVTTVQEVRPHLSRGARSHIPPRGYWGDNSHSAKGPGGQNQGVPEGFSVGYTGS